MKFDPTPRITTEEEMEAAEIEEGARAVQLAIMIVSEAGLPMDPTLLNYKGEGFIPASALPLCRRVVSTEREAKQHKPKTKQQAIADFIANYKRINAPYLGKWEAKGLK